MNAKDAAEALHKEHDELEQLLIAFENALGLAASGDDEARGLGLAGLREMAAQSTHMRGPFHHYSETVSSPAFVLADDWERTRLRQSLFNLGRASVEFRKELAFATTLSTEDVVSQGRHLLASFREEMDYEEQLLERAEGTLLHGSSGLGLKE